MRGRLLMEAVRHYVGMDARQARIALSLSPLTSTGLFPGEVDKGHFFR